MGNYYQKEIETAKYLIENYGGEIRLLQQHLTASTTLRIALIVLVSPPLVRMEQVPVPLWSAVVR